MPVKISKQIKEDPGLRAYTLESLPLLKQLRENFLSTPVKVCIERSRWYTKSMIATEKSGESMELRRAKAVASYLSNREPLFNDLNLLGGGSSSRIIGAIVYPELLTGLSIWPELDLISTRSANPEILSKEDADTLNFEVFPYWMDRTVLETLRAKTTDEAVLKGISLMDKMVYYIPGEPAVISHTTPFYEKVLQSGIQGMIADLDGASEGLSPEEQDFYGAMKIALEGIVHYAANLSSAAEKEAGEEGDPEKKRILEGIAKVCGNVPLKPASNFREAVNALWLCHVGVLAESVNQAVNPGRLDQILYPYYLRDREAGTLTVQEALELIGCLWLKIGDNTNLVPGTAEKLFGGAGSVPAVTLGGIDAAGEDAVNDLTYLMLRVTELLKIKDPNVNARYFSGVNSPAYCQRVSDVIINTKAIPAFYNDETCIQTLVNQGVKEEHARDYSIIGCVEISSGGREFCASSDIILNLSAPLVMALNQGRRPLISDKQTGPLTKNPEDMTSFEEFFEAFAAQFQGLAGNAIALNNALGKTHQDLVPSPLLSCFYEGPFEKKKDIVKGGALYNSSGATHVAFADVCDSLNAIESAVFDEKKFTMAALREALAQNFESKDPKKNREWNLMQAYLQNKTPKYGQDHPVSRKNAKRVIDLLYDFYQSHENARGGKYRPAFWTMTNHSGLGSVSKEALPSGRKGNTPFSSGITPCSQVQTELTTSLLSVAELGADHVPGGWALNMKYLPEMDRDHQFTEKFSQMIEGYFKEGGMQVQFNLYSYDELKEAKAHPEQYPELLVRVSGYSAFFKDLNEPMKDELITRTEYNLETQQAVLL